MTILAYIFNDPCMSESCLKLCCCSSDLQRDSIGLRKRAWVVEMRRRESLHRLGSLSTSGFSWFCSNSKAYKPSWSNFCRVLVKGCDWLCIKPASLFLLCPRPPASSSGFIPSLCLPSIVYFHVLMMISH